LDDKPKKNPLNEDALAGDSKQGADSAAALPAKLERYSNAHRRTVDMAKYAMDKGEKDIWIKLSGCGNYLLFREYYTKDMVRLHAAQFCKLHLLCPLCAVRRAVKTMSAYKDRYDVLKALYPDIRLSFITLTVKDGEDLKERHAHLTRSFQKLTSARRRERSKFSEFKKCIAGVGSTECKRGKNSLLWHPHVHILVLHFDDLDSFALSKQWHEATGDSMIVDIRPVADPNEDIGGFCEVFKYALKIDDLPFVDNWHAFQTLRGKRLVTSFGEFRGVEVPESLTDEPLDSLPFVEHFYRYFDGVGYSLAGSGLMRSPKAIDEGATAGAKRVKRRPMLVDEKPYVKLHLRQLQKKHGKPLR
jgi:hypothetical protein